MARLVIQQNSLIEITICINCTDWRFGGKKLEFQLFTSLQRSLYSKCYQLWFIYSKLKNTGVNREVVIISCQLSIHRILTLLLLLEADFPWESIQGGVLLLYIRRTLFIQRRRDVNYRKFEFAPNNCRAVPAHNPEIKINIFVDFCCFEKCNTRSFDHLLNLSQTVQRYNGNLWSRDTWPIAVGEVAMHHCRKQQHGFNNSP